jgi:uncharacterized membrane protein
MLRRTLILLTLFLGPLGLALIILTAIGIWLLIRIERHLRK